MRRVVLLAAGAWRGDVALGSGTESPSVLLLTTTVRDSEAAGRI